MVMTRLQNKIEDDFCRDYLVIYIKKKISKIFNMAAIIDEFTEWNSNELNLPFK